MALLLATVRCRIIFGYQPLQGRFPASVKCRWRRVTQGTEPSIKAVANVTAFLLLTPIFTSARLLLCAPYDLPASAL